MNIASYESIIRRVSDQLVVPAAIIRAIIEHESGWNPWTTRFEPGVYASLHMASPPAGVDANTERASQAMNWGLMQIGGREARARGFDGPFLSVLCTPAEGIIWGTRHLAYLMRRYSNDIEAAIAAYGMGSAVLRDDLTWQNQSYVDAIARNVRALGELPFWEPRPPRLDIRSGDAG